MPVTFHIPGPLRTYAGGQTLVEVETSAATVSEALQALWMVCPGLRDRVMTNTGEIREHINVFVGNEDVRYMKGIATRITAATEITILPAVSGG